MPHCPEEPGLTRLWAASCLLSDIAWLEHPDYRGEQAFLRAFRVPFGGIDHSGRAFLAMTLYLRYGGRADDTITAPAYALLDEAMRRKAIGLGLTLRLAYTLCGGALTLLDRTRLARQDGRLTLEIVKEEANLKVEAVERRLEALGKFLGMPTDLRVVSGFKTGRR
jgi:exopolyphosphatase/guanosine-5'-triphosphate,3'-diphosphate pyrophosphatase